MLAVVTMLAAAPAQAVDVRTAPTDELILFAANSQIGVYDLVVSAVGVRASADEEFVIEGMRLELWANGAPALTRSLDAARIIADTNRMAGAPIPFLVSGPLLQSGGLAGFFAAPTEFSNDVQLSPGEAVVTTRHAFTTDFVPDALRVVVLIRRADGAAAEIEHRTPIALRQSAINYRFPVEGAWLINAYPSLQSHHRWLAPTEFAVDLFKPGERGLHRGDRTSSCSFYGYGATVLAAADGEIVQVISDMPADRAQRISQSEADPEAFFATHIERLRQDPLRAAGGNLVVIRHESDGQIEYSFYAHLMAGSVRVRIGQHVRRGDAIARVGDTAGEPLNPHLHFQVNDGPDLLASRSLPIRFENIAALDSATDLGQLVSTVEPGRGRP